MKSQRIQFFLCIVASGAFLLPSIIHAAPIESVPEQGESDINSEDLFLQAGISAAIRGISEDSSSDNLVNEEDSSAAPKKDTIETDNLIVYTEEDPSFLYQSNTLEGNLIGMVPSGGGGKLIAEGDNWYLIQSGQYTGFTAKDGYLTDKKAKTYADKYFDKEAIVSANTAFSYEDSACDGAVLSVFAKNTVIKVSKQEGDTYSLKENGVESYIPVSDVDVHNIYAAAQEPDLQTFEDLYPEEALSMYGTDEDYEKTQIVSAPVETADSTCTGLMNEIVEYAMQFLGNPYVWGGESLTDGCDCSGFVMKIYEHFGYSLPHGSSALRGCGQDVCGSTWDENRALPGDVICYNGHVGIYIGDGKMINASNPRDGIKISSVTARDDFICARRIVSGHSDYGDLTDTEFNELCRIVESEAGGESVDSRIAVCDVILNRVASAKFPNTIHDVIFAGRQFSPVSNGRYYAVVVSESTRNAVKKALSEPDHSMGALYFMNPKYSDPSNVKWFYSALTYLFSYGDVEFFK